MVTARQTSSSQDFPRIPVKATRSTCASARVTARSRRPFQRELPFGTIDTLLPTDLNHDGQIDLVVGGEDLGSSQIATTLNTGHGSFAPPGSIDVGFTFATGDLTGDGAPELISNTRTRGTGGVCVYKNDGNGGLDVPAKPTCYPTSDDDHVTTLAVGDVNGDGTADVVVGFGQGLPSATSIEVNVLFGKSDGTLGDHASYDGLPNYSSIHLVDVNNDGKLDVVVYWQGSNPRPDEHRVQRVAERRDG